MYEKVNTARAPYPHEGEALVNRVHGIEGDLHDTNSRVSDWRLADLERIRELERAVYGAAKDEPTPIPPGRSFGP